MVVHTYSSLGHYADHLAPIFAALPEELRGGHFAPREGSWWGARAPQPLDGLWLVASYTDARALGQARRVVYVEHGAGQTYNGDERSRDHGAFSGGRGLDNVVLFLAPHETVAARWRAAYPHVPAVAVGCPKLDRWHREPFPGFTPKSSFSAGPTVAFTFHHQGGLCPETTWAVPHYREHLRATAEALRGVGAAVIGHGHPRAAPLLERLWAACGVEWVPSSAEVFTRADLLVADNTSLLPEFASLGRPVVWLNAPWYRRGVDHGGRFWAWPEGQRVVDDPADLVPGVLDGLRDPPLIARARAEMVASIYSAVDGAAAKRAAEAIAAVAGAVPFGA